MRIDQEYSYQSFSVMLTFLHVSDPNPTKVAHADRLHKVRPLLQRFNTNCKKYCQPCQNVSIAKRMVKSKGRFSCRQYVKNKPLKWRFELWVLCDASNGYTWNFAIYRGKEGVVSPNGICHDVVVQMVSGLENQGYVACTDNFYTSPTLFINLYHLGFLQITSTLRAGTQLPHKEWKTICNDVLMHGLSGLGKSMMQTI